MIQSVHIGIALAIFGLSITLAQIRPGQLDHFLPPPPSRLNPISEGQRQVQPRQRRPPLTPVTDLLSRNPYLSRAYGGSWSTQVYSGSCTPLFTTFGRSRQS